MRPRQAPPEHPFPEYPDPSPFVRFLSNIREHGFALALAVTMLAVLALFFQFERLKLDALAEKARPFSEELARSAFGTASADSVARLTVDTYPARAALFLDGTPIGLTPLRQITVPPGRYRLEIVKDAYEAIDSFITILPAERAIFHFPLDAVPGEDLLIASAEQPPPPRTAERPERRPRQATTTTAPTPDPPPASSPARATPARPQDPTTSRLELRSEPTGAAVWMDDRFVGYTPLVLARVTPGEHVLSFRKLGYESPTTLVVLQPGQSETLSPRLRALAGTLTVLAKPWGSIYIDGALVQESSNVRYSAQLAPGRYRVTVVHPVLGRWERVADVEPGRATDFVVDLNQRASSDSSPDSGR